MSFLAFFTLLGTQVYYLPHPVPFFSPVQALDVPTPPCNPLHQHLIQHIYLFAGLTLLIITLFLSTCLCLWLIRRKRRGYTIACTNADSVEMIPATAALRFKNEIIDSDMTVHMHLLYPQRNTPQPPRCRSIKYDHDPSSSHADTFLKINVHNQKEYFPI